MFFHDNNSNCRRDRQNGGDPYGGELSFFLICFHTPVLHMFSACARLPFAVRRSLCVDTLNGKHTISPLDFKPVR